MRTTPQHILTLFAAYFILLAWNGYLYGWGDMIELLPYAKWINDSSLYSQDFFIQHITANSANERFILAYFFSLMGEWMPIGAFLLHIVCGIVLLEGLYRIAQLFIRSEGLSWIAILIPFVLLMYTNLGGNEMYIPLITSSTVAKSIAIWAIYFFIKTERSIRESWYLYILLAIATFIQPLVGIQLFLVLSGVLFLRLVQKENIFENFKVHFPPILFYLLTGGLWIFIISKDFASGGSHRQFFDFLELRIPHHFIPSYFSKKAAIILLPLFFFASYYFFKKDKNVFGIFGLTMLGLMIYTIGVEVFEISIVASTQWFKTTIWLKSLSVIALVAFVENQLNFLQKDWVSKIGIWGVRVAGVFSIVMLLHPISIFKNRAYDFTFLPEAYQTGWSNEADIEISKIAKANTPKDALFLIPASNTHFKYYSERSTYIDYKAVIHRKSIIPLWLDRIQNVYGVNLNTRRSGQDMVLAANENFKKLNAEGFRILANQGVDYILTFKSVELPFPKIGENKEYIIYQLSN